MGSDTKGKGESAPAAPKKASVGLAARPGPAVSQPKQPTQFQKAQLASAFGDAERERQREAILGAAPGARRATGEVPAMHAPATRFDGQSAPTELTERDLWKAVVAPVQSQEEGRNRGLLEQVLQQFAVASNPRYEPDAPDRPRGHIYVWDVSRAMACEIPHFAGAKELSLGQTVDWLRHEGPMRGWRRAEAQDAIAAANEGQLVIALPKEPRLKHLAVVIPQEPPPDLLPKVAGAGMKRGWALPVAEVFGLKRIEFFVHT